MELFWSMSDCLKAGIYLYDKAFGLIEDSYIIGRQGFFLRYDVFNFTLSMSNIYQMRKEKTMLT